MSQYMMLSLSSSDTGHNAVFAAVCESVKLPVAGALIVTVKDWEKPPFRTIAATV
jgi:hypothetical protein